MVEFAADRVGRRRCVKAGERLKGLTFAAAYCSDTTRAQQTAEKILDINEAAGNPRPALVTDMHFREQFYGYYEGLDMAWLVRRGSAPRRQNLQPNRREVRVGGLA